MSPPPHPSPPARGLSSARGALYLALVLPPLFACWAAIALWAATEIVAEMMAGALGRPLRG